MGSGVFSTSTGRHIYHAKEPRFSARVGSGVFSTSTTAAAVVTASSKCFSARVGSGVFSTGSPPPGDPRSPGRVSVPVWALGSFLQVCGSGRRKDHVNKNCFSARVGSGVFSTVTDTVAEEQAGKQAESFSARVGSGVFSTR